MRSIFSVLMVTAGVVFIGAAAAAQDKKSKDGAARTAPARPSDSDLKRQIESRMLDARAAFFADLRVDVIRGDVLLTGRVRDPKDKPRAAALVRSVPGTQTVVNEIHVGEPKPMRHAAQDLDIERRVKTSMIETFGRKMPPLSWRATDRIVYVFGRARSEWEHNRALAVVKRTDGVAGVVDHLRIVRNDAVR